MAAVIALNGRNYIGKSASRPETIEEKALDFFRRAELSEVLERIWEFIKRQRFSTVLKLIKAVAMITAAVLLSQSISIVGILALVGSIGGLLFAAITNVYAWLIYIPLYFVRPSDFPSSVFIAFGLAWLLGVSPFVALVLSPLFIFGFRLLEHSELAQKHVSEILSAIGDKVEQTNLRAGIQDKVRIITGFIRNIVPARNAGSSLLPQRIHIPTEA